MKKLIMSVIVLLLLCGCGRPISHRRMLQLQAEYLQYELWEQPMVSEDVVFMRHKITGEVVFINLSERTPRTHAVFGPLK